ncbi:LTA synthase family protein [Hymenobacter tenuis]
MFSTTTRRIGCFTVSLLLILFLLRAHVVRIPHAVVFTQWEGFVFVLLSCYYDFLLATGLAAATLILHWSLAKYPRGQRFVTGVFIGCTLLIIWFGFSYIEVSELLGGPFTYAWLYYSDFLQNSDSKSALLANASWEWAGKLLKWSLAYLAASYAFFFLLKRFDTSGRFGRVATLVISLGLLFYFWQAPAQAEKRELTYKQMASPVLAFSNSVYQSVATTPDLFTVQLPSDFEAFPQPSMATGPSKAPSDARIRNVVLFVLESVPAEYVPGYQSRFNVMPNLARQLPNSLLVSDMYAQMPSTNNAVVSLLGSLYPKISYQSITKEHPAIPVSSLSGELKKARLRTGFFFSADTRFQNMRGFLANRKFDVLNDFQTIACTKPVLKVDENEEDYLSSADESCLLKACTTWLPADASGAPFFATIWTSQTHYPYFPQGTQVDYGVKERYLNQYLNALHYSDSQLGLLLDELKRRGLSESTLVVVVGDHGEAFGRHVQYGHASNIYEENVRIPLLFINPLLFHGEKLQAIGGQIDISPSILDILRLPIPAEWQGTSLFNPNRTDRTYFFSPYSNYLFGYREGRHKVIFNASTSKTMVFDLQKDPHEQQNLADEMPEFVQQSHQRLARWVQYQNAYLQRIIETQPTAPPVASQ